MREGKIMDNEEPQYTLGKSNEELLSEYLEIKKDLLSLLEEAESLVEVKLVLAQVINVII